MAKKEISLRNTVESRRWDDYDWEQTEEVLLRQYVVTRDGTGRITSSWDISPVHPMTKEDFLDAMKL